MNRITPNTNSRRDIDIARLVRFIRQGCLFEFIGVQDFGAGDIPLKIYRVRNIPRLATTIFYVATE